MPSWLHDERFAGVMEVLDAVQARRVVDLGCGAGDFLLPLAQQPFVERVTGVERAGPALALLRQRLTALPGAAREKVTVRDASLLDPGPIPVGQDAVVMIEVIEHLDPACLSGLERVLFRQIAAPTVVLTTPNADLNGLLGVPPGRFRHPEHRFEWGRARFRAWAIGVAGRNGHTARFGDLGGAHPDLGGASQMAVFRRDV